VNESVLAATTMALAARIYPHLYTLNALFLGSDSRLGMFARHFCTPSHTYARDAERIEEAIQTLHRQDIVVSCLVAPQAVLSKARVELALRVRKHRPMLLIDLADPPSIDPSASDLDDAFIYNEHDLVVLFTGLPVSRRRPT
jgi:glutamyl-tRNA reductase